MAGQVWGTNSLGGYMYSDQLSHELRMALQPVLKFRQFADVKDATHQGLNKGDTFTWNVYSDVATPGAELTEGTVIPPTNFTITQASMTITEYGNAVPYSGKLDNLSLHPVREVVRKVLKNDAKKALDLAAATQFALTPLRAVGTSATAVTFTENSTPSGANAQDLGKAHVKLIVDYMKERNIPAYMGDDYYALAWPSTFRPLKDDLETIHQYVETGFQFIMNGEIGRYEGTRFVEQTNIVKGGSVIGTPAGAWTGSSDWALFFGEDTVAEAIAVPEEIRGKIPTDFGRERGVAWYYLGGFGLVHTGTGNANARVVMWDSTV